MNFRAEGIPQQHSDEQKKQERIPVNVPSYEVLLESSSLTPELFSRERYEVYQRELVTEVKLADVLVDEFARVIGTIDGVEEKRTLLTAHVRLAKDALWGFRSRLREMKDQKDLFPVHGAQYLIENQIEDLLNDLRDFKFVVSNLSQMGLWQSPSLGHSKRDLIGAGQSVESDLQAVYARYDLCPIRFEKILDGTIEHSRAVTSQTVIVNSGMSAVTMALGVARKLTHEHAKVLGQDDTYFENEGLLLATADAVGLDQLFLGKPSEFIQEIDREDPQIIFFEPVANSPHMPTIDSTAVMHSPTQHPVRVVVMDYTASGPLIDFKPITDALDDHTVLLAVTSLQKLYEQGQDVTSGGMVTVLAKKGASKPATEAFYELRAIRKRIGATMSTSNLTLFQRLSSEQIKEHAFQIGKNVHALSDALGSLEGVTTFRGPDRKDSRATSAFFYLSFESPIANLVEKKVLEHAREQYLSVSLGMSFGFRDTRIMANSKTAIRVCPGVENEREMAVLQRVFEQSIEEAQAELT